VSENSKIEWTDHTFNPWIGCTRVSPGCDHCYAAVSTPSRAMGVVWGPGEARHRAADSTWKQPRTWNGRHEAFFAEHGRRQRVFCASLADVFDNAVDPQWRADLFRLIGDTPNLDWLLLTKRIGNVRGMVPLPWISKPFQHGPDPTNIYPAGWPDNVWLGATIVNQEEADRDIPKLLAVPATKRFLSMEPLLGPVSLRWLAAWPENAPTAAQKPGGLTNHLDGLRHLDWVIVGGESGHSARPIHPDWVTEIRDQCAEAGVKFLFKQWGEYVPMMGHAEGVPVNGPKFIHLDGTIMGRAGKKAAGRLLDGRTHDEFPRGQE
jgi:protein gp37